MTIPLLPLSASATATLHYGVLTADGPPVTACGLTSPLLRGITAPRAQECAQCTRARAVLLAPPAEPQRRLADGAGPKAAGHLQLPGQLRAYCGKTLGSTTAPAKARPCHPCNYLALLIATVRTTAEVTRTRTAISGTGERWEAQALWDDGEHQDVLPAARSPERFA